MILYDQNIPDSSLISYFNLTDKPSINGIILDGSLSLNDLGITSMNTFNQQTELFRLDLSSLRGSKQDKLISGVNIKTVNGQDLLGNGNVSIEVPVKSVNGMVGDVVIDVPSLIPTNYVTDEELNAKNYLTEIPANYVTEQTLADKKYLTQVPANYVTYNGLSNYIQEISAEIIPTLFIGNESNVNVNVNVLQRVVNAIKNNTPWIVYAYFNSTDYYIVKGAFFTDEGATVVFHDNNSHCTNTYTWRVDIATGEWSMQNEELGFLTESSLNDINNDISNINSDIVTINQRLTAADNKFSNYYTKTQTNSLVAGKISSGSTSGTSEPQVTTIQVLTSSQYEALSSPNANTLYVIK